MHFNQVPRSQALKADARRPKHERRTAKALYAEIEGLCLGHFHGGSRQALQDSVAHASTAGAEGVILGYTELPLILGRS